MKVFISWSGELSKNIAEIFREWIPGVIQAVRPYYSPDDITKGTRWNSEIAKELDISKIGLICLTPDNLESPWIMFESGALAKNIDKSKVVPILFKVDPSDIKGPLVQFQASKFNKTDIKRVIKMINEELGEQGLSNDVFNNVFEMWYPKLEEKINQQLENYKPEEQNGDIRSERDILEEILTLTRETSIARSSKKYREVIPTKMIDEIVHSLDRLVKDVYRTKSLEVVTSLERLIKIFGYFIEEQTFRNDLPNSINKEILYSFEKSRMRLNDLRHMTIELQNQLPFEDIKEKPNQEN